MPVVKDMEITCSALSRTSKKKGQRMSSHGYCAHSGAPSAWDSRPVLPPSQLTLSRQIMKNWEPWKVTIEKSNYHRMLEQLDFRVQHSVQTTSAQDLHPRSCADIAHPSVLSHEMMTLEPGENPTRMFTWKPTSFLSHESYLIMLSSS